MLFWFSPWLRALAATQKQSGLSGREPYGFGIDLDQAQADLTDRIACPA